MTRIAIVNPNKCKPKKCNQECKTFCPVVRMGKLCIEVVPTSKTANISEELCNGCGICVKKCPFNAIDIINVDILDKISNQLVHHYRQNSFRLYRMPVPRTEQILGIIGSNGTGKSTVLKILGNKLRPNLGNYKNDTDWNDILRHFRGNEIQNYFNKIISKNLTAVIKPQHIDAIAKQPLAQGTVLEFIKKTNQRNLMDELINDLDLKNLLDKTVANLSGGELQRFAIAICINQNADVHMYDEPSSYLDIKQRMKAARVIQNTKSDYTILVEHDLALMDYLSDYVCVFYGIPGAFGISSVPYGTGEGINIFLEGESPCDNYRFRKDPISFRISETEDLRTCVSRSQYQYPSMTKIFDKFRLDIEAGDFSSSEIIVLLGENGTGKSTLIKILAGLMKSDTDVELPQLIVSYKPQLVIPKFQGTVKELLQTRIPTMLGHPQFITDIIKPLHIEEMYEYNVSHLSGGEIQRIALTLVLGKPADIYLIDEPSAYLDSEQRVIAAKAIERFILHSGKTAFVVEHDLMMATYLADRVIVYEGEPGIKCKASSPQPLAQGLNTFLKSLDITFRRDPTNFRPRINKFNSLKDKEQKANQNYYWESKQRVDIQHNNFQEI